MKNKVRPVNAPAEMTKDEIADFAAWSITHAVQISRDSTAAVLYRAALVIAKSDGPAAMSAAALTMSVPEQTAMMTAMVMAAGCKISQHQTFKILADTVRALVARQAPTESGGHGE